MVYLLLAGACLVAFFGPGGLSGATSTPELDPQIIEALLAQFPGLQGLRGQQQGPPTTLQTLGYQSQGPEFFQGQGQNAFSLSPFESASGVSPESITGGLAQGTFGKSASQSPLGTPPSQPSALSLPSLQLPMAQTAAIQGGFGGGEMVGGQEPGGGGFTVSAGDVLDAGQSIAGLFSPGTGTAFDPGQQMQQPAVQEQRAGERQTFPAFPAVFNAGEKPGLGLFQEPGPVIPGPTLPPAGPDLSGKGGLLPSAPEPLGANETMLTAPGGSAATALGPEAPPAGDLLGGGLSTLQGLYSLYGGAQTGDVGALLGGASGTLGGLSQMAPETIMALSKYLGLGSQGLGLVGAGLGGLGGAYGLYQGVEQGDPMQAAGGAAGLYAGAAPLANYFLGTNLPSLSGLAGQGLSALGVNLAGAAAPAAGGSAGLGAGVTAAGTGGALGATAAPAGSGAALGGLGAGATGAIVAAPWAIGMTVDTINQMLEAAAEARKTKFMARQFERGLPTMLSDVQGAPGIMDPLASGTTSPEDAARIYQQLQTLQRNWQGGDPTGTGKSPGYEAIVEKGQGGAMGPSFLQPNQSSALMSQLGPSFQAMDYGRLRAQDILQGAGMTAPPGGGDWAFTPETAARTFGSRNYYVDPESGSYTSGATEMNPWLAANYQPYKGVSEQDLINAQNAGTIPWNVPQWSPEAQAALQGIQPGGLEAGLRGLFGGAQGQNALGFNQFFTGDYQRQLAEQQANDPVLQQLRQFVEGTQGLTQNADQIIAAAQQNLQGAPVNMPGVGNTGGIDLYALLRQLGYVA